MEPAQRARKVPKLDEKGTPKHASKPPLHLHGACENMCVYDMCPEDEKGHFWHVQGSPFWRAWRAKVMHRPMKTSKSDSRQPPLNYGKIESGFGRAGK